MPNIYTNTSLDNAMTKHFYADPTCIVRVTEDLARLMLLSNFSIIFNGVIRYFNIRSIGLNVYEVTMPEPGILSATTLNAYNE